MILCPNCNHKEIVGALFCSQCGAQLVLAEEEQSAFERPIYNEAKQTLTPAISFDDSAMPIHLSIHILDSGEILSLPDRDEITLGRTSIGQPIIPDVDLTPFKGYESGVSRLHASIRIVNRKATLMDLGSANGTWLNGNKIQAHEQHALSHGDLITLGKFKLQVLIQSEVQ